jgi:tetratricopeptide (TPR) repeat protein
MTWRTITGLLLAAVLILGLAAAWTLQKQIDAEQAEMLLEQDNLLLQSGSLVKKLSLEYAPLMGAIYWTRAVQYYGEKHRLHAPGLDLLWPLLDISTTLDPNLLVAYRFGSIFLSDAAPRGAGRPDLAAKLLERGIQANPEEWRLYQDLGNVYYFDAKDYPNAAAAFEEGSKNPKAAIWMKVLAAKIAGEGRSLDTSYFLWRQVYETTTDEDIRKNAESHLRSLKVDLDLLELDRLLDEYEKQTGKRAKRISELVEAGLLKRVPIDSKGFPYVVGASGKAELNLNSPVLEEKLVNPN